METQHKYVVVGGGVAGAWAIEGIRECDETGSILLLGAEPHLPYDRPPLSKKLWFGPKKVEEIFVHDRAWYDARKVELRLGVRAERLDLASKVLTDGQGERHRYEKLLLATGGSPRRLSIPGGDLEGICYYRTVDDFRWLHGEAAAGKTAVVIGGGFIGSELAAALSHAQASVTMVFPGGFIGQRVFPEGLGRSLQQLYRDRGIRILAGDLPASISQRDDGRFLTRTRGGEQLVSDLVVAGVGIRPSTELAQDAGLALADGVVANDRLQTSHPDVYVAGDAALFPYAALGRSMRVEHWDNALEQGKQAGRNLAGADEPYLHMPYFFSDLFEFGYEAVGDVDSRLETFADWQEENRTGTIYYLANGRPRGAMMCNVWDRVEAARELIRRGGPTSPAHLHGAIS